MARGSRESPTFIEEARRRQIVGAAIETIAELGYAGSSLERIAQRLGISRGLISYHFQGRADLMAAVVSSVFRDGAAYVRPLVEGATTPGQQLEAALRGNLAFMRDHRSAVVAVAEIAREGPRSGTRSAPADIARGVAALEALLRAGQDSGEFGEFDPHVVAVAIRNVIDGVPRQMARDPGLDLEAWTEEVVGLVMRSIMRPTFTGGPPDAS